MSYEADRGLLESLSLDASGVLKDVTFNYTRDAVGRISEEDISNNVYMFKEHKFTTAPVSYTSNKLNQYTQLQEGSLNPLMYLYDDNGNLTDDGKYKYEYDAENRLTKARRILDSSTSTIVGEYSYDALGRRVEKKTYATAMRNTIKGRYSFMLLYVLEMLSFHQ